jgi:hypothetical protein
MADLHLGTDPALLNPDKTDQARKFVTLAAPGFALLDKAVALPECNLTLGRIGSQYHVNLGHLRYLALASICEVELMAKDGHPTDALKLLGRRQMICTHLAYPPTEEGATTLNGLRYGFQHSIAHILAAHGREPGVAQAASQAILAVDPNRQLVDLEEAELVERLKMMGPIGARGQIRNYFDSSPSGPDPEEDDPQASRYPMYVPGPIDKVRAEQIKYSRELIAAARKGAPTPSQLESALNDICIARGEANDPGLSHGIPPFEESARYDFAVRVQSMNRILQQACKTFEAWKATGKVPSALPGAGVDATDPFTNQPFQYSSTRSGFKIYGVDNGADLLSPPKIAVPSDVVFEFPARAPAADREGHPAPLGTSRAYPRRR